MDFQTFKAMDKAELHVHLEGAMRIERVLSLAAGSDHPFAGLSVDALRTRFQTANFMSFLQNFMAGYRLLRRAEHFQMVTEDLLEDLEAQGVSCAQILYSPGVYSQRLGVSVDEIHRGIAAGLAACPGLKVTFIIDTVLNLGLDFMGETLRSVLQQRPEFVGGFSVGGGDPNLDITHFLPLFHRASAAGLFCVAHAGEVDGPVNIDILLRETEVKRIAHGCNAIHSPDTLALMKRRGTVVDVNITSNLFTGSVSALEAHPLPVFRDYGIPVTLNTDDPLYFSTDLYKEYIIAKSLRGIDDAALREMAATSLRAFT